jgi:hypothetical protein
MRKKKRLNCEELSEIMSKAVLEASKLNPVFGKITELKAGVDCLTNLAIVEMKFQERALKLGYKSAFIQEAKPDQKKLGEGK